MTTHMIHTVNTPSQDQNDIVELWRQAFLGDGDAREALLQRLMPASERPPMATILSFDAFDRQPKREAA